MVAKYLYQHNLSIDILNADFERPHLVKSHMDLMAEAERPINDNQSRGEGMPTASTLFTV